MKNDELEPYRAEFTAFLEHMEVGLKTHYPSLTQKEVLAIVGLSLFAETRNLERDNSALMEDAAAQIQIAREAVERSAEFERDAARYRWLRRQSVAVRNYASGNPNWEIDWALRGESFEAAIDAARTNSRADGDTPCS